MGIEALQSHKQGNKLLSVNSREEFWNVIAQSGSAVISSLAADHE